VCPVSAEATIWIVSLHHAIGNLIRLAQAEASALGAGRALTTPSLAVSVAQIVDAIARVDARAPARIRFVPTRRSRRSSAAGRSIAHSIAAKHWASVSMRRSMR
jgi:hypothetical protein